MQKDLAKQQLKSKKAQNTQSTPTTNKNAYKYMSKYHAQFLEPSLRDQAVKRRDVVKWNFIGDLNQTMSLKRLARMMNKMKRIKDFMLVTIPSKTTNYKEFAELGESIKRQRGLEKIYVNLMYTSGKYVNKRQADELAQSFQRVKTLKDVHLSIDQRKFSDEGLNVLSESFRRLCALKNLSVEFHNTEEITDKGLEEFGEKLKRLDSLREISIGSGSKRITNEGLQALGQNLKKIKLLEHIKLSLKWFEMDGLVKASEILREICQIQKITLDFSIQSYLYDGDDMIKGHLCPGLQEFSSFKSISVKSLSVSEITDDGLRLLCEALEKLKNLQELSLHYGGDQISPKGIQVLSQTLRKFSCLKTLQTTINCEPLTDNEISLMSEGLKEIVSLENFHLMINQGKAVTHKGLGMLAGALNQIKSLRTIALELGNLNKIDDKGIDVLTRDLQEIGLLKEVTLKFRDCPKMTNESLKALHKNLDQISSLRRVRLHFMDCEQIGLKEALELGESLKNKFICKVRHSSDSVGSWDYA